MVRFLGGDIARIESSPCGCGRTTFRTRVIGRRDDMFKVRGATVYPSEVEGALRKVEGVRQAFVTKVPGEAGDEVGALVISGLAPDALDAAVRMQLSSFKVPSLWYVTERVEDVPRTPTDKVAQPALQTLIGRQGTRVR